MTYLTRIPVHVYGNARNDGGVMHKAVMRLFPRRLPGVAHERRAASDILFRIDHTEVIIRSRAEPSLSLAWGDDPPAGASVTVESDAAPLAGRVRLLVHANTVRKNGSDPRPIPDADVPAWAAERFATALTDIDVTVFRRMLRPVTGRGFPIQVHDLAITGTVADPAELSRMLREGIGRARAYGCGLVLVDRARA